MRPSRRPKSAAAAVTIAAAAFLFTILSAFGTLARAESKDSETRFTEGLAAFDAGDYATALEIWETLADQGSGEAQLAAAQIYQDGLGVPANPRKARKLYERAARSGNAVGALNYAEFLFEGRGGPRDPVGAYVWMKRAAGQGRQWAVRQSRIIGQSLNAEEKQEAQQQLEEADM